MTAVGRAPARAALAGNPSDGHGGRVVALALADFGAIATAEPATGIACGDGHVVHRSPAALLARCERDGHDHPQPLGRLLTAATARLLRWLEERGRPQPAAGVRLTATTTVPRQVGLAGSSAIVVAALRALRNHWALPLDDRALVRVALESETVELGIAAGLQDRVALACGGLVALDVAPAHVCDGAVGRWRRLDPGRLPPLLLAWDPAAGESSGAVHGDLRARRQRGDRAVAAAMADAAAAADDFVAALAAGDRDALGRAVDATLDARLRVIDPSPRHRRLAEIARDHGAAVNFAGSGGAVVALRPADPATARTLIDAWTAAGCAVREPWPAPRLGGPA
ncbi:mevalonate kinase family protein [Patulibacter defluvii]|uniref:mevalonate kinase family protein n=1 Tax=Patulibacter defluvii TaxID=3095358 RepID=UPI002A7479F8|nr:hypothetical protein [Patulibacter sp. DM4]